MDLLRKKEKEKKKELEKKKSTPKRVKKVEIVVEEDPEDVKKMKDLLEKWSKKSGAARPERIQERKVEKVDTVDNVKVDMTKHVTVKGEEEENTVTRTRRRFSMTQDNDNDYETWKRKRNQKRKLEEEDQDQEVKRRDCRVSEMVQTCLNVKTNPYCCSEEAGGRVQAQERGVERVQAPETRNVSVDKGGGAISGIGAKPYAVMGGNIRQYLQAKKRTATTEGKTGSGGTT